MDKDNKLINLTFYICMLVFNISISLIVTYIFISNSQPTYIQENNIIKETCEQNITREIELIARNVSQSTEYKLNRYDCTQFSRDLVRNLSKINVSAYCVFGYIKNPNKINVQGHTFVGLNISGKEIFIESTGGYYISEKEFNETYKILNRGYCL